MSDKPNYERERMLVQHVRDNVNNKPFATVVAVRDLNDGGINIGWSKLNPKDNFTKARGTQIAVGRAHKFNKCAQDIPSEIDAVIEDMIDRAIRYYDVPADFIRIAGVFTGR